MRASTIHFPRSLRQSFTRAAKKTFPKETFAFCLGTKTNKDIVSLTHLFYPAIILENDGLGMTIPDEAEAIAATFGASLGVKIYATIHSHPFREHQNIDDCSPSEVDWAYNDRLMGICSVVEYKGKLRARYKFWPHIPTIKLTS